jgi:hypothetical protein
MSVATTDQAKKSDIECSKLRGVVPVCFGWSELIAGVSADFWRCERDYLAGR